MLDRESDDARSEARVDSGEPASQLELASGGYAVEWKDALGAEGTLVCKPGTPDDGCLALSDDRTLWIDPARLADFDW